MDNQSDVVSRLYSLKVLQMTLYLSCVLLSISLSFIFGRVISTKLVHQKFDLSVSRELGHFNFNMKANNLKTM